MNVNIGLVESALSLVLALTVSVSAQAVVSNASVYAKRNMIDTTVHSKGHAASVAALKASGVVDTLK